MGDDSRVAPTVLRFRPQWPYGIRPRWVLWPAWTRRVAAPAASDDRLPPFEKAVLGCARAGILDSGHVADLLQIHPQLVDQLKGRLVDRGALLSSGELTAEGLRCIESGELDAGRIEVRHIFQCALSGALFPRIADAISFAEVSRDDKRWTLEMGTPGDPKRTPCFLIPPARPEPPEPPDAADVLRTVMRHSLDQRASDRTGRTGEVEERPVPVRTSAIRRVTIVDRVPELVHLATVIYQAADAEPGELDWRIADPFGLGESSRLLREGQRLRRSNPPFNSYIESLSRRKNPPSRTGDLSPRDLWELALEAVTEALPDLPREWPGRDHLTRMHEAMLSASVSRVDRQRRARLKDAAQNGRSAVEACFSHLADRFPLKRVLGLIPNAGAAGDSVLKARLERARSGLGVQAPLPQRFANVRSNRLLQVVRFGDMSSLTPAVMATLMAAEVTPEHVLRSLLQEWPSLLDDLARVIDVGGDASHFEGRPRPMPEATPEDLEAIAKIVHRLTTGVLKA